MYYEAFLSCNFETQQQNSAMFLFHSTTHRVPVNTRAIIDFNFGAAPLGGEPCELHLNLKNTGSVPAEW